MPRHDLHVFARERASKAHPRQEAVLPVLSHACVRKRTTVRQRYERATHRRFRTLAHANGCGYAHEHRICRSSADSKTTLPHVRPNGCRRQTGAERCGVPVAGSAHGRPGRRDRRRKTGGDGGRRQSAKTEKREGKGTFRCHKLHDFRHPPSQQDTSKTCCRTKGLIRIAGKQTGQRSPASMCQKSSNLWLSQGGKTQKPPWRLWKRAPRGQQPKDAVREGAAATGTSLPEGRELGKRREGRGGGATVEETLRLRFPHPPRPAATRHPPPAAATRHPPSAAADRFPPAAACRLPAAYSAASVSPT